MRRFRLFTFIKEGFKGVFRNGLMSVASILVLFSSLFMIGIFTTIIKNVNYNLDKMEDFNELVCYMKLDATQEQVAKAGVTMKSFKNVTNVTFVSKEAALEAEKQKYGDEYKQIFEMYEKTSAEGGKNNPLPDAYRIEYKSVNDLATLEEKLSRVEGVETVRNSYAVAQNIQKLKNIITLGGTWLMVLLVIISVFVIANTIKITYHSRELEIGIMRYIGATKTYITMPFVFESVIISAVSAGLGYLAQWYVYTRILRGLTEKYDIIDIIPYTQMHRLFLVIYFGAGLVIGVFGSIITIRKYMKV